MSEEQVRADQIRARERAATDGPWVMTHPDSAYTSLIDPDHLPVAMSDGQMTNEDAAFIAAARSDVPWLLDRLAAESERANRLQTCDCASAGDGNPHHQGYCRSLPTKERRERARRFAESYAQLIEDKNARGAMVGMLQDDVQRLHHDRDTNALARQLADAHDETEGVRAEVEDWREKWAIVDEDRCEAQRERDAATERAERAEAALRAADLDLPPRASYPDELECCASGSCEVCHR
jgi:hypothetical protein